MNTQATTVWLISGVPLSEEIDGLFQDPPLAPEGIHWRVWARLETYLQAQYEAGESVTYASLAAAMRVSETYPRNHKWLNIILAHSPERWEVDQINPKNGKRGGVYVSLKRKMNG